MGIIREPEGVEFTVEPGRRSVKEERELSAIIAKSRQDPVQIEAAHQAQEIIARYEQRQQATVRENVEAAAIALPAADRVQLVHRRIDSLTTSAPISLPVSPPKKRPSQAPRPKTSAARKVVAESLAVHSES